MIPALDKIYPRKKFGLCLDTSSLQGFGLPILEIAKKIRGRIAHAHLSESPLGTDIAGEIKTTVIPDLVKYLEGTNYPGFYVAEINGAIGPVEGLTAQIYGLSSIIGLPILKNICVRNAQKHIKDSCYYLMNNV